LSKQKKDSHYRKYGKYYQKYKVLINMEFTREFSVRANSKKEAAERLEEMIRAKQKCFISKGMVLGDIEALLVEEIKNGSN